MITHNDEWTCVIQTANLKRGWRGSSSPAGCCTAAAAAAVDPDAAAGYC